MAGLGPQKGLVDLAASVADGHLIDWEALEADAQSEYDRRVIRELRLIAGMAELHRTHAEEEGAAPRHSIQSEASAPTTGRGEHTLVGSGSDPNRPPSTLISAAVDEHARRRCPAIAQYDRPAGVPLGTWGGFTLIEKVGEGAFGEVYRARDALHRDIALKLLRPRAGGTLDQIAARMLHEGRVMARIRHANVVDVYGAEEHEGRVGLSMEFVRGRTLEALLESQGTFSAREAALIGRELCRALAATHAAGLVHRDIKARNVMREEGGRVVLMDFGAGRLRDADGDVRPGRVTGTPLYLAPELFAGGEATIESDIYSVGILLFHLVTRSYPVAATLARRAAERASARRTDAVERPASGSARRFHPRDRTRDRSDARAPLRERGRDAGCAVADAGDRSVERTWLRGTAASAHG